MSDRPRLAGVVVAPDGVLARRRLSSATTAGSRHFRRHRLIERGEDVGVRPETQRGVRRQRRCRLAICTFSVAVMPGFSFSADSGHQ
jgi:hypothetical protein